MQVKAGYWTPMLHVAEVERSLAFYELLGFERIDDDRCTPIGWARMHCEGGAVMFLRAEGPVTHAAGPVLFVMYTPDLPALRAQLVAAGTNVSEITRPEYMPSGVVDLRDPDGYPISINHWGDAEHAEWLRRIGRAPAGG